VDLPTDPAAIGRRSAMSELNYSLTKEDEQRSASTRRCTAPRRTQLAATLEDYLHSSKSPPRSNRRP
jgi:hypothetical protein